MYRLIEKYVGHLEKNFPDIPPERKTKLCSIADYFRANSKKEYGAQLTFICTHNSRRSHLCQIWSAVLVEHVGLEGVQTFSGGTEATAFNPRAVEAIKRAGFKVTNPGGENPRYQVHYEDDRKPLTCYSKTFDDPVNPQADFAAIMTCSDAEKNCPYVPGATSRFSIPYIDPKEADDTPIESQTYDERCRQIAAEMYYLMLQV